MKLFVLSLLIVRSFAELTPQSYVFDACEPSLFGKTCVSVPYYSTAQCCLVCGGVSYPHKYHQGRCIYDTKYNVTGINQLNDESTARFYTQKSLMNLLEACCEFCGPQIGDYSYEPREKRCHPKMQIDLLKVQLTHFNALCLSCRAFAAFLNTIRTESLSSIIAQVKVYCEFSWLLRGYCKDFIETKLASVLADVTKIIDSKLICERMLYACKPDLNEERNLVVPRSRKTILQDHDGPVQPHGSISALPEFNYEVLVRDYLGLDEPGPNGYDKTIKFLAKHSLHR